MLPLKHADIVKNVARQTGLSESRAVEVIKKAGIKDISAYPSRTLSNEQQEKLVRNLPGAIKESGYKVDGASDESGFRQKISRSLSQAAAAAGDVKPGQDKKKPSGSAVDFLKRVHQGIRGSSESTVPEQNKQSAPVVSGSAQARQETEKKPAEFHSRPPAHVELGSGFEKIEAATNKSAEPRSPDIG